MVRIVLSEPDRDGVFVPQLAVTTGDETEALTFLLYGVSHSVTAYANRLGSVGKLSNRIDISQAMGGVPQAVTFDFDLIDWDGFGRVSISLFEAAARFVGWEVSLIVGNADPINLAVKNCSTNGDTISFQCCSRYEITSRPCAFGAGGQQVGLVVGGHDVSVETAGLPEPVGIFRDIPGTLYQGNPSAATNFYAASNIASSKAFAGSEYTFYFNCKNNVGMQSFFDEISSNSCVLVGKEMAYAVRFFVRDTVASRILIFVSKAFYDTEDASDVGIFAQQTKTAIAAGADSIIGFIDGPRVSIPEGEQFYIGDALAFRPHSLVPDGFRSFTLLPASVSWDLAGLLVSDNYYNGIEDVKTNGADPGSFDGITPANVTSPPVAPAKFTVWDSLLDPLDSRARIRFNVSLPIDWKPDRLVVDMKARLVWDSSFASFGARIPFYKATGFAFGGSGEFSILPRGAGYFDPNLAFDTVADLNASADAWYDIATTSSGASISAAFQLLAVTVYGQTNLSFGSNSAVVTPGAGPLDAPEGTFPARATGGVTLPEAAACILSSNGWFPQSPGNYPVGTVPTWTPSASAVGEYLEPSLSFIGAAEKLARESWAIFALEQNALGTSDELPEPPTIMMGQDTDIVTEPTIEYQPFGGKYLGKAYISNVDQVFDATNPDAFYGGWGLAPAGAEEAEGTDYGYLIWQRCRAAFLAHGIKRGESYQFDGIHDAATMGRMWWEAKRNGFRRIDWLAFHPRYMTFSVKRFSGWGWAGSSTRLPQIMAGGAGYDVAAWGPLYNDAVVVVAVDADPMTGATTFSVALPPVVTDGHDISLTVDTLNNALDLSTDTLDSGLPLTTDTLEG